MLERFYNLFIEYQDWLTYLTLVSLALLIISILLIPKIIAAIPTDYFAHTYKPRLPFSITRLIINSIKNILGSILIMCGIFMLVLPGQGLLTIFVGLLLLKFPGKYKLERYLIRKPAIYNSLNWIRRRQKVADLIVE